MNLILVPKPGYGLLSPKATTLPNSTRYAGIVCINFLNIIVTIIIFILVNS